MKVQFNDAVSRVQGLDSFFYLLNQYTGVTTSIPATCIKVANDFTVEFNVIDCFGDVLDAKTVYVFFISQRMRDGELQTLSSVKGVPVSEKAFALQTKSVSFKTVERGAQTGGLTSSHPRGRRPREVHPVL